ncbi:hypothetical protein Poli38472_014872, partial [Pythium oligandrum]
MFHAFCYEIARMNPRNRAELLTQLTLQLVVYHARQEPPPRQDEVLIALAASLAALVSTIEPISANSVAISSDAKLPSPTEALDTVKNIDLPKGITLSGTVEPIQAPASIKDAGTDAKNKKESDITDNQIAIANDKQDHQDHQE